MRTAEQTPQQLDPLGTLAVGRAVVILCALIMVYAVISTMQHANQLTNPMFAAAALIMLGCACGIIMVASAVAHAPVTRMVSLAVIALALSASALSTVSTWGANLLIQDDWGQYAVALLITAIALTRPAVEIIATGLVASVVIGALAAAQASFLYITVPTSIYVVVAVTPVAAFTCASAGYSHTMTRSIRVWQQSARAAIARMEPAVREVTARVVYQEQVTQLNAVAVPLFTSILERDELTADDIERAREIGAGLRVRAVAAVERSWLDEVVFIALAAPAKISSVAARISAREYSRMPAGSPPGVDDPGRVAELVGDQLRAVLSAFITAVARHPGFDGASLNVALRRAGPGWKMRFDARIDAPALQLRSTFVPYLAAVRMLTDDSVLRCAPGALTLKFSHDRS
jgi:hypothetical protein